MQTEVNLSDTQTELQKDGETDAANGDKSKFEDVDGGDDEEVDEGNEENDSNGDGELDQLHDEEDDDEGVEGNGQDTQEAQVGEDNHNSQSPGPEEESSKTQNDTLTQTVDPVTAEAVGQGE